MTALAIHTNYDWKKQMWTRHPIIWATTIVLILLVIILTEIWTIILNKWRSSKISFFTKKENLCELLDGKDVSFLQLHFLYSLHFFASKIQPWSFHSGYWFLCFTLPSSTLRARIWDKLLFSMDQYTFQQLQEIVHHYEGYLSNTDRNKVRALLGSIQVLLWVDRPYE